MAIVVLKLPLVKHHTQARPKVCPSCEGATFQRWGQVVKPVKDMRVRQVKVYRYRCCRCKHTFRYYPQGVGRAEQTERLKQFAVLCWVLGLSYRHASLILSGWQVSLAHMTIWRDVQAAAQHRHRQNQRKAVRILGLDGAYVRGWGGIQPVLVGVDLGDGQVVALGSVNESDPGSVKRWLRGVMQSLGVSVVVSDDLFTYRVVSEQLGLGHQVCQFHLRRWAGHTLKQLRETVPKDWLWVVDEIEQLLEFLPPEGDKRLYALWKQLDVRRPGSGRPLRPVDQLRSLLLRLSEHWQSYCAFQHEPAIPWTNNLTEQAIGRMKMRARTVRGYKTPSGMLNGLLMAASAIE
jgi:transposase-like protein